MASHTSTRHASYCCGLSRDLQMFLNCLAPCDAASCVVRTYEVCVCLCVCVWGGGCVACVVSLRLVEHTLPLSLFVLQSIGHVCGSVHATARTRSLTSDDPSTGPNRSGNAYGTSPWGWISRKSVNNTLHVFEYGLSCVSSTRQTNGNGVNQFPPTDGFESCGSETINGTLADVYCRAADTAKCVRCVVARVCMCVCARATVGGIFGGK